MGFKVPKNLYKLKFEDPSYNGLEVTATTVNMETILWVQSLGDTVDDLAKTPEGLRQVVDVLIGAILSWNLEDDEGAALPVTAQALLAQPIRFVLDLIAAWTAAITGVSGPLGDGSISGPRPQGLSLPMEPLSPSPPS